MRDNSLVPDILIFGTAVQDVLSGIYYEGEVKRIGGKALNQAVAFSRLGGYTSIVTAVGDDEAAKKVNEILLREKIYKQHVRSGHGRQFLVNLEEFVNGRKICNVNKDTGLLEALTAAVYGATATPFNSPGILSTTFEIENNHLELIWNYVEKVKKLERKMFVIVNPAPMSSYIRKQDIRKNERHSRCFSA